MARPNRQITTNKKQQNNTMIQKVLDQNKVYPFMDETWK